MTAPLSVYRFLASPQAILGCCLLGVLLMLSTARAQKQESGMDRILQPDRTQKFDPADKAFNISSAVGNKQASVKAFSYGSGSATYKGNGTFHSKAFTPKNGGFRTEGYDAKTSALSQHNSFAQADKGYGTKAMDVREAPAANKSMDTKAYNQAGKPFEVRGKRQDGIDDVYKSNKNLSVDQIRDLLNKGPSGRP